MIILYIHVESVYSKWNKTWIMASKFNWNGLKQTHLNPTLEKISSWYWMNKTCYKHTLDNKKSIIIIKRFNWIIIIKCFKWFTITRNHIIVFTVNQQRLKTSKTLALFNDWNLQKHISNRCSIHVDIFHL